MGIKNIRDECRQNPFHYGIEVALITSRDEVVVDLTHSITQTKQKGECEDNGPPYSSNQTLIYPLKKKSSDTILCSVPVYLMISSYVPNIPLYISMFL